MARELDVDLHGLKPAKGSRIQAEDVRRVHAAASRGLRRLQCQPPQFAPSMSSFRRAAAALAERLTASFNKGAHFYLGVEVDATQLVELRASLRGRRAREEARITFTDFFLKAMARSLSEMPSVNTFWQNGKNPRPGSRSTSDSPLKTDQIASLFP